MTITIPTAAALATECLRRKAPHVVVSAGLIRDLVATHRLPSWVDGVDAADVEDLFSRTHVLDGCGLRAVRVSVGPMKESAAVDSGRAWAGVDFANTRGLTKKEIRAGYCGAWPLSEREVAEAARGEDPLLPSLKGFVDASLSRRVVGGHLDLTTGRRWLETKKLTDDQRQVLFPNGAIAAWITVPRGRLCGYGEL